MTFHAPLTAARLREALTYDPGTGIFRRRHDRIGKGCPHKAGDVAGTIHKGHGYVVIGIDGRKYLGHRLAWLYVHGEWPPMDVDHRNLIRDDNHFDNLRLATGTENMQNTPRRRTNTSGFKGVSYRSKHPLRPWRATIKVGHKQVELGFFTSPEQAANAYKQAAQEHYGAFARLA